jgi:hypothetical protein
MKEKLKTPTGQASEEEISKWKKQFGEIFAAKVEGYIAYFKKPDRGQLAYAIMLDDNPVKQTEYMLKECFIGGSEVIIQETDYLLGAMKIVDKLMEVKMMEVEKL